MRTAIGSLLVHNSAHDEQLKRQREHLAWRAGTVLSRSAAQELHCSTGRRRPPRAVRLLLGLTKRDSAVLYLTIEPDDAPDMVEQTEI